MSLKDTMIADLTAAYQDAGVPILYNGHSAYGLVFNEPTEALPMGDKQFAISDTTLTLTVITGSIGLIANGSAIVVDGTSYTLKKPLILADGLETKMNLVGLG